MDPQWGSFVDSPPSSRQARYAPHNLPTPQHPHRDPNGPTSMKQDPYQSPSIASRAASMAISSPPAAQSRAPEYNGDGDGDVPMEDADAYNKPKYPSRPSHHQRHSSHFIQQEDSAAARRYSPMNLSPSSPYGATSQQPSQNTYSSYTPQTQTSRQSPTRNNPYMSPPQSYYNPSSKFASAPNSFAIA